MRAGGGRNLSNTQLIDEIRDELAPRTTLLTPNRAELSALAGSQDPELAAESLLKGNIEGILVTGADAAENAGRDQVTNQLFRPGHPPVTWNWPRLPDVYHGSGCTLASACAAALALGQPLTDAVETAQQFTWDALQRAEAPGRGQWLPKRSG